MSELDTEDFFQQLQKRDNMPDDLGELEQEVSDRLGQMVPAEPEPLSPTAGYRDNPYPIVASQTTWLDRARTAVRHRFQPLKLWLLKKLYITCW